MSQDPIGRLIRELGRLPGVGERSAARLAYYIIRASHRHEGYSLARDLSDALTEVDAQVRLCDPCQNLSTSPACSICQDAKRDISTVCVVEGVADLRAMEQAGGYRGLYHVLHGALSPLDGIGPRQLKIEQLSARLAQGTIREVILATNSNVEGDATALYLAQVLGSVPTGGEGDAGHVRVTRLASGIPQGGELEYLDGATLTMAMSERRAFGS